MHKFVNVYDEAPRLKAAREALEEEGHDCVVFEHTYLEEGGEQKALMNMHSMVKGTLRQIEEAYGKVRYSMFLTGSGNFRDQVATIKPYKGNRERSARPILFSAIRREITEAFGAETVYGIEADDIIAVKAREMKGKAIIVHVDKDLLQIPGDHFVPGKGARTIKLDEAQRLFYQQIISGDTADNIGGVYKAGQKAAELLITEGMTAAEMWDKCVMAYNFSILNHGDKTGYAHMSGYDAALENARLLYLKRAVDAPLWEPPKP